MQPTLTIFANFNINNEERFKRMKDSFYSYKNIKPDQWIINIRGDKKFEVGQFLKQELGDKIILFYLNSCFGWFYDSKKIASKIKSDYVFIWIEDHILTADPLYLKSCIAEMKKFNADQLHYSFLTKRAKQIFSVLSPHKKGEYITVTKIDNNSSSKIHNKLKIPFFYIVSLASIMSKDFFIKIIYSSKPYLKKFPRKLPFDFEKISQDKVSSIIYHALPNKELFASIDDDLGENGYSLISRGVYKTSLSRDSIKKIEYPVSKLHSMKLYIYRIVPKNYIFFADRALSYFKRVIFTVNIFFNK
jgi:hypothetical protein